MPHRHDWKMQDVTTIANELAARAPAHSLGRDFYLSPDHYQVDLERVWYTQWLFVGHLAETPNHGDYRTLTVGDHQLIVIRGTDDEVRVRHNVCRHRGSLVCIEHSGTAKRLVCPYHQWSYHLDGRLAGARKTDVGFEPSTHGLRSVRSASTAGMLFICLDDDAPSFNPVRELVDSYLAPFDLERAEVAAVDSFVENGNWKLVMENNRECFHCHSAHKDLCVSFPEAPLHTGVAAGEELRRMDEMVEYSEQIGLPSRYVASEDLQYRLMRMPLNAGTRSMTPDGQPLVSTRFGSLPDCDLGDVLLYHYPSTWNHFMADHAVTFQITPVNPTQTRVTTTWLVPHGAKAGVDYDLDRLTSVWRRTNSEDTVLVENAQRGVNSPAYRPGPYSAAEEDGVIQFVDWYANVILRQMTE